MSDLCCRVTVLTCCPCPSQYYHPPRHPHSGCWPPWARFSSMKWDKHGTRESRVICDIQRRCYLPSLANGKPCPLKMLPGICKGLRRSKSRCHWNWKMVERGPGGQGRTLRGSGSSTGRWQIQKGERYFRWGHGKYSGLWSSENEGCFFFFPLLFLTFSINKIQPP